MKISKAKIDEINALYKIASSTPELRTSAREPPMNREEMAAAIKNRKGVFLVSRESGRILGFSYASMEGKTYGCLVYDVVIPSSRGKGIGKSLAARSEEWLKSKGAKSVYGLATNQKMVKIMVHLGYKEGKKLTWLDKRL
ncbi:MAG: GNAT family N-acetyltransferase [Candidatus Micrarchaeota archaeon]|nr:GNAT family N-acetyltransferase [Candidatus Micrarchaeota archaeon]MDE1847730.1 GNAT family N-acetyltransferase [Candidatus Micrarchaeota archaeon]MDE1864159.1 GNAT family N-acetyltransferase [Candidatus Micrarchaeota archaeon]